MNKTLFPLDVESTLRRAKAPHSHAWVEDSFMFEKSEGRQVAIPGIAEHIGTSLNSRRKRWFLLTVELVLCAIAFRMFFLQVVSGDAYRAIAEGNRERLIPIPSERGLIFDRNGTPLTKNVPKFSLAIVPQTIPRDPALRARVVDELSHLTGFARDHIESIIRDYGGYGYESLSIVDDVPYETALSLQIAAAHLPGIDIIRGSKREYIQGGIPGFGGVTSTRSFSHILGYEGKLSRDELDTLYSDGYLPSDFIGKIGVEKTYEPFLRGAYGKRRIEVNALGREQRVIAETPPAGGKNISLTIDAAMQAKIEDILHRALQASGKRRAAAVAMDPRTGELLALVSLPTFDNNNFSGGIASTTFAVYADNVDRPLFSRAISGTYPSGSVIKPAIASAGLEENIITKNTTVRSTGGLQVGPWFFPDWKKGGHGNTNVRKALAESVNTFFYYVGGGYKNFSGLGVDKIRDYLAQYGFGSILGLDLSGEAPGFIPSKEWKLRTKKDAWYVGDTYNLSIGEGDLLVTPLQIANMTATIANGGTVYRPRVVRSVGGPSGRIPEPIRSRFILSEHLAVVRQGMRDCVLVGSCRRLATLPFPVAGKTGTAQWRKDRPNHAWFTSFGPYDAPEIVFTVLIEEGGEGSAIAVPVADEFYRWYSSYRTNAVDKRH